MEYEIDEVAKLPDENETGLEDDLTSNMESNKPASYTPENEVPPVSTLPGSQRTSTSRRDTGHPDPSDSTKATQRTNRSATQETLPRRYRRKHVRTIFKHVCQSMYELSDWDTFVQCMRHLIKGLDYMRRAGWVHRDISGGNCLWDPASRQGKLADLEYARPYKHESLLPHEARTGTPAFMAVEYQMRKYLYSVTAPLDNIYDLSSKGESVKRLTFTYNFYHDLESLIWLYAWAVYFRPPLLRVPPSSGTEELLRSEGHQFFACGIEGNTERTLVVNNGLRDNRLITDVINAIVYGPTSGCRFLIGGMETIRHLAQGYHDIQSLPTNDSLRNGTAIWSADRFTYDLYKKFDESLEKVADLIKEVGDTFPMRHISSRREKTKRHRTEDPDSPTHHSVKGNKRVKRSGES
ncbi:hypothetical protein PHLCEN_2v7417 [Hermanssonia centrifuga]|uniref:Fungal-type protein kinase domain-containing protein n=1 Tax=Hermanssonia centrifuga TaxID=98765 RepID=A0A2R6NWJ8_9APHY|nr:hypothetical protein PHLCEN_2v7417 [Hermanssonia centrifuga]